MKDGTTGSLDQYQTPWELVEDGGLKITCAGNMTICDFRDWEDAETIKAIAELIVRAQELICPSCGQTDTGQTGEYPCGQCGLPTTHDRVE